MADSITSRLRHAWNVFTTPQDRQTFSQVGSFGRRPDRPFGSMVNMKTILPAIYTRIAVDASAIDIKHVNTDTYEDIVGPINEIFTVEANIDQAARHFRKDVFWSLITRGVIAIVPIEFSGSPLQNGSWNPVTVRVGEIVQWFNDHVTVRVFNEKVQTYEDITLPKKIVAIVENPLYETMNEPSSTLQRLVHKLNLLDKLDDRANAGRLDMIIQLPYVIKTNARREEANKRLEMIETQLSEGAYGIAYTDGTEKITQLNRPVENNLREQIKDLREELYSELGLTPGVFNGQASEAEMLNYHNRTIRPLLDAVTEALHRTFLTKTARTQKQAIIHSRNPFEFIGFSQTADLIDKLSRNEIMSPNEIRPQIGLRPVQSEAANELRNRNVGQPGDTALDPAVVKEGGDPIEA